MRDAHNKFRLIHDAPPLKLNSYLSRAAQDFANELARKEKVLHSNSNSRPNIGESIAQVCTTDGSMPLGSSIIKNW